MCEGKAIHYHALREASRNYISELTSIVWRFQFKQAQDEAGNIFCTETLSEGSVWSFKQAQDEAGNIFCTETLSEGSIRSYSSTFDDDFTIISESHMQTMHYTMRTISKVNPSTGAVEEDVSVQRENFPQLRFSRLNDGIWRMENKYVYFTQPLDSDLGRSLPLI